MAGRAHCLVLAFPGQGHINPSLHFSKLLESEGVKVTLVTTRFSGKGLQKPQGNIALETISDGFDNGGPAEAASYGAYYRRFCEVGPQNLAELVEKLATAGDSVDCIVYDSAMPWALDVAKRLGLVGAAFLSQSMVVNSIHYHFKQGKLRVPGTEEVISLPALPQLQPGDLPSFLLTYKSHQTFVDILVGQFSNIDKADWVLCNTFYDLEKEVADWTKRIWPKFRTIGPHIPSSMFFDTQPKDDENYGVALLKSEEYMKWLDDKPKRSVVYISCGSMIGLNKELMEELACALIDNESYFLWVVKAFEETKLPKDFAKTSDKGLVVPWCVQTNVLAHEAIGCFLTHCGWNSTLEALSLGVPMVAMPQWSDQITNAKLIADVWKTGIRAPVEENKVVKREALKHCIRTVMESEEGKEMRSNAIKWKTLAARAVSEGGSSQKNLAEFASSLFHL